jgi:hypothetical protein
MNAEQYLNEALGGNMNIGTLKPLAWHEIMEGYARHKIMEAQAASNNNARDEICRCHFGSVLMQLNNNGMISKLKFCSMCGGKLSPVALLLGCN